MPVAKSGRDVEEEILWKLNMILHPPNKELSSQGFKFEETEKWKRTGAWIKQTQYAAIVVRHNAVAYSYNWFIKFDCIALTYKYPSVYTGVTDNFDYETPEAAAYAGMDFLHKISKLFKQPTAKPKVNKELTQHWLGRFQQILKELENGPITPFTELQKEGVISQIEDLEKQLNGCN